MATLVLVAPNLAVQVNQLQKAAEILEMLKVQPHFQGPQGAATSSSAAAPACGLSDAFINTEDAHVSHEPVTPAAPAAPAVALAMETDTGEFAEDPWHPVDSSAPALQ